MDISKFISKITDPQAKTFIVQFLRDREINTEYYKRVPEEKYDFRMVDTPERKSDSPRESLIHQIYVTRNYIYSVEVGKQEWSDARYDLLMKPEIKKFTKGNLLDELEKSELELIELLRKTYISKKSVKVPWAKKPIPAINSLWGLDSHEILHQGWNLSIMDHLNIDRFQALKDMWR